MHAACGVCRTVFAFHPNKVPSARARADGPRIPICRPCVEGANPKRVAKGLAPIDIAPGAYDGAPEAEIDWGADDAVTGR